MTQYGWGRKRVPLRSRLILAKAAHDPSGGPATARFRADIEGLRAVAVLAVVFFHAGQPGVSGGFIGVDVFFVISGFLITGLLWREMSTSGSIRLRSFYGARARRLLPASATVGVVITIVSIILLPPLRARTVIGDGIASALYVSNYRFASQRNDYFVEALVSPSPFQHYWSLGVEEQFYLVWPLLLIGTAWVIQRVGRRAGADATSSAGWYLSVLALFAAASFGTSLMVTRSNPSLAFYSLQTRAWELAMGGVVALTVNQWRRLPPLPAALAGWAGLGVILLACARLDGATPYPGTAALLPVLSTVLVIGAGCAAPEVGAGRLLALPPMQAIGRISYSWYLWHWPVGLLAGIIGLVPGASVYISGGLAWLTMRFIENPVRFAAPLRQSSARSLGLGGAATAVAVLVGVAALVLRPAPVAHGPAAQTMAITAAPALKVPTTESYQAAVDQAFARVHAAVTASVGVKAVPSNLDPPLIEVNQKERFSFNGCLRPLSEVGQPECGMADLSSMARVALIGDSHAAMWTPAFQELATQRHWRLELLSKAACPLIDLSIYTIIYRREYTECAAWRDQIIARLQAEGPRLIVLSVTRLYSLQKFTVYDSAWTGGLKRLVQRMRETGAAVLVLGPIPHLNKSTTDCLSVHLDDATACSALQSTAVNESGIAAERAAVEIGGGDYADLTTLFCANDRCPPIVGNTLVYFDDHMTLEYSRLLAPAIGALADRTLFHG